MRIGAKAIGAAVFLLVILAVSYFLYRDLNASKLPALSASSVSFSKNAIFGATINSASKDFGDGKDLVINTDSAKKEIDSARALGAGLVRLDVEKKTLDDSKEMKKLDEVVSYARAKKMKICLAFWGSESWLGSSLIPGENSIGGGRSDWEQFKREYGKSTDTLAQRYQPDYFLILPDCPDEIGRQINSKRTLEEWLDFSKDLGVAIKKKSYSTKVVLENVLVSQGLQQRQQTEFARMAIQNSDASLDAFFVSAGSAKELEDGVKKAFSMKEKYHWGGELWLGRVDCPDALDAEKQKDFFLYAMHLANASDFKGIILSQFRDGVKNNGVIKEDYTPKASYEAIKTVLGTKK